MGAEMLDPRDNHAGRPNLVPRGIRQHDPLSNLVDVANNGALHPAHEKVTTSFPPLREGTHSGKWLPSCHSISQA